MKIALPLVVLATIAGASAIEISTAAATEPCTGPFRHCATEVQAYCSRDTNGRQRMTYWDSPGYTYRFERCVGAVFRAAGKPDPYTTGVSTYGNLTVPYTELLYPMYPNR
jgi:hypothetical protein